MPACSTLLYTAKGTASLLVPLAKIVTTTTGSWHAVFVFVALMDPVAAVMAIAILLPLRRKALSQE